MDNRAEMWIQYMINQTEGLVEEAGENSAHSAARRELLAQAFHRALEVMNTPPEEKKLKGEDKYLDNLGIDI